MHSDSLGKRTPFSRLLIVEDDPSQLRTLTDILTEEGFSAVGCPTAAEALRQVTARDFAAVILDLRLPDEEGTRLLEQIRAVNAHIRVIIYTGFGTFGSARDAVNRGAFAYVEKLGDPGELIRHVHRAVAERVSQYATELELAVAERTAALRESEAHLRAIVEAAVDAIVVVDDKGTVESFNPAAERMFGYAAAEVVGGAVALLFPAPFREEHASHLAHYRLAAEAIPLGARHELGGLRKDGTTFPVDLGVSMVRDGPRCRFVEILRDLTERKRAEEERLRLERQVRQAQKMEALGTLAGGVAHDFNNILAGIRGYVELYQADRPPGAGEELSRVLQLSDRAALLVRQILAFSRKREQERVPVDLGRVLEEAVALLRATLPATIEIRAAVTAEPVVLLADATEMHQVVMNLCTNAAHAMRDRGGILDCRLEIADCRSEKTEHFEQSAICNLQSAIKLTVADTGAGMTAEVRERMFDPFFTTKETGEGTGMGLSVVLGIVEGLGGNIRVESEPGRGTRFEVYLPRASGAAPPAPAPAPAPAPGRGCILLVDDEPAILSWAGTLLRRLGYNVEACDSGVRALECFHAAPGHFDLVVTDQTMPKMSGTVLVRELLRLRPDLPAIMMSGYRDQGDESAEAVGVRAFLMKPFSNAQLAEAVRLALGRPV